MIALALTIVVPVMAVMLVFAAVSSQAQCGSAAPVSVDSAPGVPSELLAIYDQAAGNYQLGAAGWAYLAAINYVETDFGQDLSVSSAGAVGWMQFEPGTWSQYAVSADPTKPGALPNPDDPWDAIFTAASYLHASGAPASWPAAIYAYNHAGWYVAEVQQLAQQYAQTASGTGATTLLTSGPAAVPSACPVAAPITPGPVAKITADGVAQAPADAPAQVQDAIAAGDRIIDTAYSQERTPNMLATVMSAYDCSGSTDFVLYNSARLRNRAGPRAPNRPDQRHRTPASKIVARPSQPPESRASHRPHARESHRAQAAQPGRVRRSAASLTRLKPDVSPAAATITYLSTLSPRAGSNSRCSTSGATSLRDDARQ